MKVARAGLARVFFRLFIALLRVHLGYLLASKSNSDKALQAKSSLLHTSDHKIQLTLNMI
jgi:hypothetical protein